MNRHTNVEHYRAFKRMISLATRLPDFHGAPRSTPKDKLRGRVKHGDKARTTAILNPLNADGIYIRTRVLSLNADGVFICTGIERSLNRQFIFIA